MVATITWFTSKTAPHFLIGKIINNQLRYEKYDVKWYEKYFCIWETWSEKSRWPKRGMVKIELCPGQAPSLMSQKLFPLPPREHPPHKTPFPVPEFSFPPHVPAVYGQALLRANRCFWRLRTLRTMTFPMTNSQYLDDQEGGQTESCIGRGCVRRLSPEHSTNPPWPPLRSDKYEWSPTSGHFHRDFPLSLIHIISLEWQIYILDLEFCVLHSFV